MAATALAELGERELLALVAGLPDGYRTVFNTNSSAGQTVFHLHFHIIPRWEGQALGRHAGGGMADPAELAALAEQIAAKIG